MQAKGVTNNLMLRAALNRLEFWKAQLDAAVVAGNHERAGECARFVEEYGTLISAMSDTLHDFKQIH